MIRITHNHIDDEPVDVVIDETPRYAMERLVMERMGEDPSASLPAGPEIPFRLIDEDKEIHYSGVLSDDPECVNQMAAQRFGESATGATDIEVQRNGRWTIEIG